MTEEVQHKNFAIKSNNDFWTLIDRGHLTPAEKEEVIHLAHASLWHWSKVGQPINLVRGYYVISRAYFSADKKIEGIYWGEKCWDQTEEMNLMGFDLVFGLEISARCKAAQGLEEEFEEIEKQFHIEVDNLDKEDKDLCMGEWNKGPWFNLK